MKYVAISNFYYQGKLAERGQELELDESSAHQLLAMGRILKVSMPLQQRETQQVVKTTRKKR